MLLLCHQVRFTSAAWSRVLQNPKDSFASLRSPIESLGGRIKSVFFSLGSYDVLAITEFPEDFPLSSLDIVFSAGGEVASIQTTRLLDASQAADAARSAGHNSSPPPLRPRSFFASAT